MAKFRKGDILVTIWDMKIVRTISHSWSSDSQQPEPFVKLIFQGPVKETKGKFARQRYDVFSEKFTPFSPNPPPPLTEIFRNIWASLFRSNPENARRLSDQKDSRSQDGGEAGSTADPNPEDAEDRDSVHSDGSHEGQDSSHQDSGEDGGAGLFDKSHEGQNSSQDGKGHSGTWPEAWKQYSNSEVAKLVTVFAVMAMVAIVIYRF